MDTKKDSNDLDRNELAGICADCGRKNTATVDGVHSITTVELADIQLLWCENCLDSVKHTNIQTGGDM